MHDESVVATPIGGAVMADARSSMEELIAYATSKLGTSSKVSFFDTFAEPEIPYGTVNDYNTGQMAGGDVTAPSQREQGRMGDPEARESARRSGLRFQPLLNHVDDDGWSVTCYVIPPQGDGPPRAYPRHFHYEDQVFVVLEGELRQGNRRFGPGSGVFIPARTTYGVQFGPDGARYLEIRHGRPADRGLEFVDDVAGGARDGQRSANPE
jgi:hypothetical protein